MFDDVSVEFYMCVLQANVFDTVRWDELLPASVCVCVSRCVYIVLYRTFTIQSVLRLTVSSG